jgi:hypothetical protein
MTIAVLEDTLKNEVEEVATKDGVHPVLGGLSGELADWLAYNGRLRWCLDFPLDCEFAGALGMSTASARLNPWNGLGDEQLCFSCRV